MIVVPLLVVLAGCPGSNDDGPGRVTLSWGGPGREPGLFYRPRVIAAGEDRLFIVDMSGRIQIFDFDGTWRESWLLDEVSRGYPSGLDVRSDGFLGVADTHNYAVRMYSVEGTMAATVGSEGGGPGEFTYLTDVAFARDGTMFVSEHGRVDRVQRLDKRGRFLSQWGRSGDGPGEFHRPQALAIDEAGAVYVADAANHRVQKFSPDGDLLAVWGGAGREPGRMLYPYDLAFTPSGHLLVCEYGNNRIQAFDAEGRSRGIWGRPGHGEGELATPWGVAWVEGRGICVVDTGNHRIQCFAAPDWLSAAGQ